MGLSTHVLDQVTGAPVAGLSVILECGNGRVYRAVTNDDGRCTDLLEGAPLEHDTYTLRFDVGTYFAASSTETFYQEIPIQFVITDTQRHYHVPLLLSPFGYATYRGS